MVVYIVVFDSLQTFQQVKLAVAAASVTFVALQSASLALTTTPPEQLALALGSVLRPFKVLVACLPHISR